MSTTNTRTPHHPERKVARAARGSVRGGVLDALGRLGAAALVLGLGVSIGCASTPPCRKGAKGAVVTGARTAGEAVETGAKTGVEGVKAAGRAVGGLVEGGSDEAKKEWNKGKVETDATARKGAAEVDKEANVPVCEE